MKIVNIQQAKTHLSRLVEEAVAGEELVIAKAGKPLVRLVPFREEKKDPFIFGALAGQGWIAPDCWDPDPELERLFYEGDPNFPDLTAPKVAEDPR